ncbi:hypothetical protein KUCAC02_000418 [Chaenocephalus aceratus]|uniref:Uncharacterized protein n=1 Tax=Chaenocephalus aceratus TaxID=36190 RepID=A0ACB9W6C9_CHAAC|nr:hypothetical protein KUCAC02_000418 [Chaenocephalus aceratus]
MGNGLATEQKNREPFAQHKSLTGTQRKTFGNRKLRRSPTDVTWRSHFQSTDVTTEHDRNINLDIFYRNFNICFTVWANEQLGNWTEGD